MPDSVFKIQMICNINQTNFWISFFFQVSPNLKTSYMTVGKDTGPKLQLSLGRQIILKIWLRNRPQLRVVFYFLPASSGSG